MAVECNYIFICILVKWANGKAICVDNATSNVFLHPANRVFCSEMTERGIKAHSINLKALFVVRVIFDVAVLFSCKTKFLFDSKGEQLMALFCYVLLVMSKLEFLRLMGISIWSTIQAVSHEWCPNSVLGVLDCLILLCYRKDGRYHIATPLFMIYISIESLEMRWHLRRSESLTTLFGHYVPTKYGITHNTQNSTISGFPLGSIAFLPSPWNAALARGNPENPIRAGKKKNYE